MKLYNPIKSKRAPASDPHNWVIEMLMMFLSTSAFLVALTLLLLYDNKPLSSWLFPLSFNTIISILGAISRASLAFSIGSCISQGKWNWFRRRVERIIVFDRFDDASRGPWGSIRLLYWLQLRHWVALGALCTVTLLGFEPFLQAGITFYGKDVDNIESNGTAQIGRTHRLDAGKVTIDGGAAPAVIPTPVGNFGVQPLTLEYDFQLFAALWTGFSNLSSTENQKPSFICSSGNCTWPPYASIAVCSTCADISTRIVKSTGHTTDTEYDETMITRPYIPSMVGLLNRTLSFTKYEIRELGMNISNFDSGVMYSLSDQPNTTLTAKATNSPGETISFRDFQTLIGSFGIMQTSSGFREGRTEWEESRVTAMECALYFCTNVYKSAVTHGTLDEAVIESHAVRNLDSFTSFTPYLSEDFKDFNKFFNYSLYPTFWDPSYMDIMRSDLQIMIPPDTEFAKAQNEKEGLHFNISQNAVVTIVSVFMDQFARRSIPLESKQLVYPDTDGKQPSVILSLGASPNITATFENVAAIMTKWIRDTSPPSEFVTGTTNSWVLHIRVQWPFLSLPAVTFLLGCTFCFLSVLETRRLGLKPWKGSSLATLAVELDYESQEHLEEAQSTFLMDEYVRETKVQLVESERGMKLGTVSTGV